MGHSGQSSSDSMSKSNGRRTKRYRRRNKQSAAKGGIFIAKELIIRMMALCGSRFDTDIANDEKAAFGYFKESKSMQIIGGQIGDALTVTDPETGGQCQVLLLNIDLKFESNG